MVSREAPVIAASTAESNDDRLSDDVEGSNDATASEGITASNGTAPLDDTATEEAPHWTTPMQIFDGRGNLIQEGPGKGTWKLLPDGMLIPVPPPVEVSLAQQVAILRNMLRDPDLKAHHDNIRTLIRLLRRKIAAGSGDHKKWDCQWKGSGLFPANDPNLGLEQC
jgi:hypothetical protein